MALISNYKELFLWLWRFRQRFRVTGNSMFPLLKAGEEVLVDTKAYHRCLPKIGDLVIAWHPQQYNLRIVKRVVRVDENGKCFLMGENSLESSDSRSFGWVSLQHIIGKVTSKFP